MSIRVPPPSPYQGFRASGGPGHAGWPSCCRSRGWSQQLPGSLLKVHEPSFQLMLDKDPRTAVGPSRAGQGAELALP